MLVRDNLLKVIAKDISQCTNCPLHENRINTVPGEGPPKTDLVMIGEGPGADEDKQGKPFVGRAGKLLSVMIERMGLNRNNVHILNVCKCRPPNNRPPEDQEMQACFPYLEMQLKVIDPKVIVALGATATKALLGPGPGITKRRGGIYHIDIDEKEIIVIPTLHPAACLRNPSYKKLVAEDLSLVLKLLC